MQKQKDLSFTFPDCYKLYVEPQKQDDKNGFRRVAGLKKQIWKKQHLGVDQTIYYHFLSKDQTKNSQVRRGFQTWKDIGIWINFKQTNDKAKAYFIIKYGSGNTGDYSYVGYDNARQSQRNDHTMSLSFNIPDKNKYFGTILHEIGHAIGLQHQHQNPRGQIQWNKEIVYKYYSKYPKQMLEQNIFKPAGKQSEAFGTFIDRQSIMVYQFPADCFISPEILKKQGTLSRGSLTERDISFVKSLYPDPKERFTPIKNNVQLQSQVAKQPASVVIYFENPTTHFFTVQSYQSNDKIVSKPEEIIKWNSSSVWSFTGQQQSKGRIVLKQGITQDVITINWNVSAQDASFMIEETQGDGIQVSVLNGKKDHVYEIKKSQNSTGKHLIARLTIKCSQKPRQPSYNFQYKK